MASGRRSGRQNILRSLLDEEEPREKANEKINTVTSPPCTRNQMAQSKETTVGNKKLSPPNTGSQSPDPNCSICLGKLENKSFTDSCFHMFCFACLLEWSKVKAECPLCKQPFKSIIHNVRSYEDYDQYNIQEAQERVPSFPWDSPTEGFRFRYRTTVTFDRLMEAHYEEQQRQLRLLYPNISTRSQWRRRRQSATSEFRHRIYLNSMRVTSVRSRKKRQRKIGPTFYRSNPACTHRLVPWLNRELNALLQNQHEHVHFLMELIMDLIKRFDIESDESFEHLHSYLGRNTRHFLHEFSSFARSPYDMVAYDENAVYEPYTETISDEEESFSSPGSDIIIVDDIITTTELPTTRSRKKRNRFHLDPDLHNPEQPTVIRGGPSCSATNTEISTTSTSGWDSPTPGPSGLFASPLHTETVFTSLATVDISPSQNVAVKNEDLQTSRAKKQTGDNVPVTSDSETDSDDSVVILKVEKPWFERTPITISSGSDGDIVVKNEDSQSRKSKKSKRKHEEQNTSESRNTSSNSIDVTSVTSEPKHKKHKHKHDRGHKKGKNKHKKSSRHSHKSDIKSSEHSRNSEKQGSRKAAEERRNRRHSKPEHSLHYESRSHSDFPSVSSAYGSDDLVRGKYGEFFEWLQHNDYDDSDYRYPQSWDRKNKHDSRSRSRSYESLWPSSSRSRSPTLSISPIKKRRLDPDLPSHHRRSRSSSIECIAVVDGLGLNTDRKHTKKHKKHKKHKHKKSKMHVETIKSNSDIEVVDVVGDEDVLDLVTSGENSGSKLSNSEGVPVAKLVADTEIAAGSSSQKSSEGPDSAKKYKKHPTGHKTSSFKPVKIKRNTELLKSLQDCMLPASCAGMKTEICDNLPKDMCNKSATNISVSSSSLQSLSALDLSTTTSSKNDLIVTVDLNSSTESEKPQSAEVLGDIDVVTCDDLLKCDSPGYDSESTIVDNDDKEPDIDVENSDFETCISSDQEIDVVTCDTENKVKESKESDINVKSSSETSFSDLELDVVSVEPMFGAKEFCKNVFVDKDASPEKQQICKIDFDKQKSVLGATKISIALSAILGSSKGLGGLQLETDCENKVESIHGKDLSLCAAESGCQDEHFVTSRADIQPKLTDTVEIVSDDEDSVRCVKTANLAENNLNTHQMSFDDESNDKLQQNGGPEMLADEDQETVACNTIVDLSSADINNEEQVFTDKSSDCVRQSQAEIDITKSNLNNEQNFINSLDGIKQSVNPVANGNMIAGQNSAEKSNVQRSVTLGGDFDLLSTDNVCDENISGSKWDGEQCVDETVDTCITLSCNLTDEQEDTKQSDCEESDTPSSLPLSDNIVESSVRIDEPDSAPLFTDPALSIDMVDSRKIMPYTDCSSTDASQTASVKPDSKQNINHDVNIDPSIETLKQIPQNKSESEKSVKNNVRRCSENSFDILASYSPEPIGITECSQTTDNVPSVKVDRISTPDKCHTPPEHNILVH